VCTVWWSGSVSRVWCLYCVLVCQPVIDMYCLLCGGVAACDRYGACTQWWRGSVIGMLRVMCGGVAACHMCGACNCAGVAAGLRNFACTVWWFRSMS